LLGYLVGKLRLAHPTRYTSRRWRRHCARHDRRALLQKYISWLRAVFDLSGSKRSMLFAD
jgi:hypothetical protein